MNEIKEFIFNQYFDTTPLLIILVCTQIYFGVDKICSILKRIEEKTEKPNKEN